MFILSPRLQFIQDSDAIFYEGIDNVVESKRRGYASDLANNLTDIAVFFTHKIGIKYEDTPQVKSLVRELECFVRTGDFEPITKKSEKIVCFNPTLLTLDDQRWEVFLIAI